MALMLCGGTPASAATPTPTVVRPDGGPAGADPRQPSVSPRLLRHFNAAIADAAVYRRAHLRPLRPLTFAKGSDTAVVATLTGDAYKLGRQRLREDVWVTGAPEVQCDCQKAAKGHSARWLATYLRQLLGLHPSSATTHFVTFSVKRGDVFRPAVNPDPTTRWPCGTRRSPSCGTVFPKRVSRAHVTWMANEMLSAWIVASPLSDDGYPWTRLGYTYDWRRGADRYGASEYVVRPGSLVDVQSVTPYQAYCSSASVTAARSQPGSEAP